MEYFWYTNFVTHSGITRVKEGKNTMAKKIIGNLKLRIPAGRATAGPPVGSTLGQWGLNMMDFINPFNDATKDLMGKDVIVHMQVFEDRTFAWKSLGQPVDDAIREKIGIKKGSGKPKKKT